MKKKIIKDNPETPKQWHRYYLNDAAKKVKENTRGGYFVECGVKQGTSSVIMSKALGRPGILFDTWSGFPGFSKEDIPTSGSKKRVKKRCNRPSTKKDCIKNLKDHGVFSSCQMIQGDILKTVPDFNKDGLSICMIHIDTDIYEPAKISLESFWDYIIDGGAVYLHDYKDKKWVGIQKAVDDFVKDKIKNNEKLFFYEYPSSRLNSCLIIKGKNIDTLGIDERGA
tara:strand:+ start:744 stop:1418 length:675 start_codon:yes stop_codon:yes gene_type:complete